MRALFSPRSVHPIFSLFLLVGRVVAGGAMALHGWGKITNPTGWGGEKIQEIFPEWALAVGAIAEFGGGIALALGVLYPLAALGFLGAMGGAIQLHALVLEQPLIASDNIAQVKISEYVISSGAAGGNFELAAMYFVIGLFALVAGPGALSLDRLLFRDKGAGRQRGAPDIMGKP